MWAEKNQLESISKSEGQLIEDNVESLILLRIGGNKTIKLIQLPSELAITTGRPASRTPNTEFVVPRSIPTIRPMSAFNGTLR